MIRKRTVSVSTRSPRRMPASLRRLLTAIAVGAAAAMMVALSTQYSRTYTLARQAARLEQHRRELLAQNELLREEIQRLQTDDRYVERIARQQLGLVRPGEIELLIVPPGGESSSNGPVAAAGPPHTQPAPLPWAERIREIMEHLFGWIRR